MSGLASRCRVTVNNKYDLRLVGRSQGLMHPFGILLFSFWHFVAGLCNCKLNFRFLLAKPSLSEKYFRSFYFFQTNKSDLDLIVRPLHNN